jgi:hypothetical protein
MRRRCMNRGLAFRAAVCATHVQAPFVCSAGGGLSLVRSGPSHGATTRLDLTSRPKSKSSPHLWTLSNSLVAFSELYFYLVHTCFIFPSCLPQWRPHGTCLPLLPPFPPHGAETTSRHLHATTSVLPSYALCQSRLPQSAHSSKKDGIRQPCAERPPTPMRTRLVLSRPIELSLRTCLAWVGSFSPFPALLGVFVTRLSNSPDTLKMDKIMADLILGRQGCRRDGCREPTFQLSPPQARSPCRDLRRRTQRLREALG